MCYEATVFNNFDICNLLKEDIQDKTTQICFQKLCYLKFIVKCSRMFTLRLLCIASISTIWSVLINYVFCIKYIKTFRGILFDVRTDKYWSTFIDLFYSEINNALNFNSLHTIHFWRPCTVEICIWIFDRLTFFLGCVLPCR